MTHPRGLALLLLLALVAAPAAAQGRMSPREQANLALVSDWWRAVIQAAHVELADRYMDPGYIQHNPNIDTGRDAFVTFFGRRQTRPIPAELSPAPLIRFARGDYVVFVWEREDAAADGTPYTYNFFDVVRVENGRVAEHWDSVHRPLPESGGAPPAPVEPGLGPPPVPPPATAAEAANVALATAEFPDDEPELTLASGDLVLLMFRRFSPDPAVPGAVYKWNWFDMVRVEDGRIQEHWDQAIPGSDLPETVDRPPRFREYRE